MGGKECGGRVAVVAEQAEKVSLVLGGECEGREGQNEWGESKHTW